jgi:hypothetical protein
MPARADEDVPDVYAPWRDWAEIAASAGTLRQRTGDRITVENWEDFWPAARKTALTEFRRRDPDAARTVLEMRLANEDAGTRLRLLGLLAIGLSDADRSFLDGIVTADRAPKVKSLAASLLARLGHRQVVNEEAAELANFFSVQTKGLLPGSHAIEFENAKTAAQRQRRAVLFANIDIGSFANALGLAPQKVIEAWTWDVDHQMDSALIAMVAATGTDALVAFTAETASQRDAIDLRDLAGLTLRLSQCQRAELAAKVLHTRERGFETAKGIAGAAARLENLLATTASTNLLAALKRENAKPSDQAGELFALGLIASRACARQALELLSCVGLLQGDPRLDMLRLNAALADNGVKE